MKGVKPNCANTPGQTEVLYVTVISFAVIRVISAVFLKDTLDAAQNDAENLVVERLPRLNKAFSCSHLLCSAQAALL